MRNLSNVLAIALVFSLGLVGCDSVDPHPDGPIEATGRVVLSETGEPVAGLGVAIVEHTGVGEAAVATVRTDADGRFALRYVVPDRGTRASSRSYRVEVNLPYDQSYSVWWQRTNPPVTADFGTIEIERSEAP